MTTDSPAQVAAAEPLVAFDSRDPEFRRNPYPRYAELREAPVLHQSLHGFHVLTRHADVLAAVRETRLSSHPRHRTDAAGLAAIIPGVVETLRSPPTASRGTRYGKASKPPERPQVSSTPPAHQQRASRSTGSRRGK